MRRQTEPGGETEETGVSGAVDGPPTADTTSLLRRFIERDYVNVVAAVGMITHDRANAEAAVHAAMVKLLTEQVPTDGSSVASWITVAATSAGIDTPDSVESLLVDPTSSSTRPGTVQPDDQRNDQRDDDSADQVMTIVGELPLAQRQTAVLHYFLDAPVIDIATGRGVTEDQASADLREVQSALTAKLGASGAGDDGTEGAA